ncbi:glutaredoxin [Phaeobacter sp. 11ANDIMAR09]|uniref:glutaredoxin n=1 Tax=Phaeobacter sp. 11ANDIMAR09 TaxID=1225647 RepID=UPI0006C8DEAE|nr:glutaredoxin [Phaeobacter sp. 11ANDIMAR09]KPD10914.1 glutaredoxin [Phaeobacter sp. 11ANDIMAR09]OIQ31762.1 MAG: glutaredoxin [Roseobacter sp. MedPE-SWchi]
MRKLLRPESVHSAIEDKISSYHAEIVQQVEEAVAANGVVVVGMKYNPFVSKARKALQEAGIAFTYLEYGSYTAQWHKRLALKMWSGWATFPMVFVDQRLVGGFSELQALLSGPVEDFPALQRG